LSKAKPAAQYHTYYPYFLLLGSVGLPAGASSGGASGRVVKNYHVTIQENPFLQIGHKNILRKIIFDDSRQLTMLLKKIFVNSNSLSVKAKRYSPVSSGSFILLYDLRDISSF
jgi:hypothetical protein